MMKIFVILCVLLSAFIGALGLSPIPQGPLKVTYINGYYPGGAAQAVISASNAGFNVIILAFYMTDNTAGGIAADWDILSSQQQIAAVKAVHNNGGVVLVSVGGATDQTWLNLPGSTIGNLGANFVISNNLDGLDFDLEGAPGMPFTSDIVQKWTDAVNAAAAVLKPASGPQGIIAAAPYGPWFGPIGWPKCYSNGETGCTWVGPTGGMTGVYANVGSKIDYLFIQYYNQLTYVTQNNLFIDSTMDFDGSWDWFPQTAVKQIAAQGIPIGKLVVGKPVDSGNSAADGFVVPATLNLWILSQNLECTLGGVGIWEWTVAAPAWIAAAWPLSLCSGQRTATLGGVASGAATATITGSSSSSGTATKPPSTWPPTTRPTPAPTAVVPPPVAPTTRPTPAQTAPPTPAPTARQTPAPTPNPAGPTHPCATNLLGDWCWDGGYVTCPFRATRPCQAGLSCHQTAPGIVYCM